MRDVDGIGRGLDALRAAGKPVLICAPEGRSEAARRSIVAHTGALAGNTTLRDAWLRARGAVLVEDPVTMFEAALLLSKVRKLRATGIAAALQSGGACTLFAEAAGTAGLDLPEFSPATKRRLRKVLPHYASQNNPLDVTGQAAVETEMYEDALEALANDPSVGLIAFDAFPPRLEGETPWADPVLRTAKELRRHTRVAFVSVAMGPLTYEPSAKAFTQAHDLPFLQGHRAAAGAIAALVRSQRSGRRMPADDVPAHSSRGGAMRALRGHEGPVDEETGAKILTLYGVPRPEERTVTSPERAAQVAGTIGFPVVVKALAPEIPHKAKLGGVRLGLGDAAAVEVAAAEVLEAAKSAGARAPKVLVQQMVRGAEVLVGAVVDDRFGPMITVRPGGALAEEGEAEFVPCPLTPAQARAFVAEQAARCGLDPEVHDVRAAAKAVEAIARIAHDLRGRLISFEANPLLVGERGAVAVDALAEVRSG
jgi:acyl-CoA synthetase (NDP forming)